MKAIDLFAGLGGFTAGAEAAGIEVVWAANHWRLAVDVHHANHPHTSHDCQDLHQADWSRVQGCNLVLASPCCQGHTHARGKDRPHHDASRSTAWAVVSCCEYHRPEAVIVENVPEFRDWKLYGAWSQALHALGYQLTETTIDAADCGVPQHRRRLFIVGSRRRAITIDPPRRRHRAIAPHLRWDWPRWSPISEKVAATRERAAAGRERFGDRFVMPYYGSGSGKTGRSIDRPLGTITCTDRWAIVDGDRMRMLQVPEYRAGMGFASNYRLTGTRRNQIKLLGNAVCPPVAEHVIRQTVEQC